MPDKMVPCYQNLKIKLARVIKCWIHWIDNSNTFSVSEILWHKRKVFKIRNILNKSFYFLFLIGGHTLVLCIREAKYIVFLNWQLISMYLVCKFLAGIFIKSLIKSLNITVVPRYIAAFYIFLSIYLRK